MSDDQKIILYATNSGDDMGPVFHKAVEVAACMGGKLVVVHVAAPLGKLGTAVLETYVDEATQAAIKKDGYQQVVGYLRDKLERVCLRELDGAGLDGEMLKEVIVVQGQPAEEIIRVAEDVGAHMTVIGTGGGKFLISNMVGSVARQVTHISRVPVLLVRSGD